jgi:hypothetical protein
MSVAFAVITPLLVVPHGTKRKIESSQPAIMPLQSNLVLENNKVEETPVCMLSLELLSMGLTTPTKAPQSPRQIIKAVTALRCGTRTTPQNSPERVNHYRETGKSMHHVSSNEEENVEPSSDEDSYEQSKARRRIDMLVHRGLLDAPRKQSHCRKLFCD